MKGIYFYFVNKLFLVGRYWDFNIFAKKSIDGCHPAQPSINDWLDSVDAVLNIIFYIVAAIAPTTALPEATFTIIPHNIISNLQAASHIIIIETMVSGEGGMSPVAMTMQSIKRNWLESNQRRTVLMSAYNRLGQSNVMLCSMISVVNVWAIISSFLLICTKTFLNVDANIVYHHWRTTWSGVIAPSLSLSLSLSLSCLFRELSVSMLYDLWPNRK